MIIGSGGVSHSQWVKYYRTMICTLLCHSFLRSFGVEYYYTWRRAANLASVPPIPSSVYLPHLYTQSVSQSVSQFSSVAAETKHSEQGTQIPLAYLIPT